MTESNCQDGKLKTPKRHESHQFINHINQPFVKAKSFKDFLVSHPPGVMIPVMIQFEFDEDLCKCWFNHPTSCALMFYSFFFLVFVGWLTTGGDFLWIGPQRGPIKTPTVKGPEPLTKKAGSRGQGPMIKLANFHGRKKVHSGNLT